MLEPSFRSNIADLACEDPDFEWFLLVSCGYDAMLRVMTIYGVDLLYYIPGTGR